MNIYKYQVKIGENIFSIKSELELQWSQIDSTFLWCEPSLDENVIPVSIFRVDELPYEDMDCNKELIKVHSQRGLSVYTDQQGKEIREYQSFFYKDCPVYAQSRIEEDGIHIWIKAEDEFFKHPNFHIWNIMHLEHYLLAGKALVLHCCYMMYQGEAILFSAPSGTGKTTQGKLWEATFGSKIINGDRGLLQRSKDGNWKVCGYPYHGSAAECENLIFPIKAIVVVRQDPEDSIVDLSLLRKTAYIYSECIVNNWNQQAIEDTMALVEDLCSKVPVCELRCTMNINAAYTLHDYLYGTKLKEI